MLLVNHDDFGRDLTGVQNARKKHKRVEAEISSHEPTVQAVQETGDLLAKNSDLADEILNRTQLLATNWAELISKAQQRSNRLDESLAYQQFGAGVDEEHAWISEKRHLLNACDYGDSIATVQGLLKKHTAFDTDFAVHEDRFESIKADGAKLCEEGNHNGPQISERVEGLSEAMMSLKGQSVVRFNKLNDNCAFLQFIWKTDVVDSWIADKTAQVNSEDYGRDLSSVQILITKEETFDAGLQAFEREGIDTITSLKDKLIESNHEKSDSIQKRYDQVIGSWQTLLKGSDERKSSLLRLQKQYREVEDLYLTFAKKASTFNSWFENAEEDLTDPVRCNSGEEIKTLQDLHTTFKSSLSLAENDFRQLEELDRKICDFKVGPNPYTWFTMTALEETWESLQNIIKERDGELEREEQRQIENDKLRQNFALAANAFHEWLTDIRTSMMEAAGTLEDQLELTKDKVVEVANQKGRLKNIEDLSAGMEERLILDNRYTEHSMVGLAQQWDQLNQLAMRMQHNLEQQIQACNQSGVSPDSLREFSMMFKHFDKDKTGRLDHAELKSCLRALGYDFPLMEDGEKDTLFDGILDTIDPNRDGFLTLQEYMAFMISRETENVQTAKDIEIAFKAITANDRAYILSSELYSNLSKAQADYCLARMKGYADPDSGRSIPDAYDYSSFTNELFIN